MKNTKKSKVNKNLTRKNVIMKNTKKSSVNKNTTRKCNKFCKKTYVPYVEKLYKKNPSDWMLSRYPDNEARKYTYDSCNHIFCNEGCKGYNISGNKEQRKIFRENFYKNIKNNFDIRVKKDRIKMLKSKGVISECNYLDIYNP